MSSFTCRPLLRCSRGVVAAGHYLGAVAGQQQLAEGGNAIDAAAAASFALAVVEPHLGGFAGEVPILIHSAQEGRVVAISGQGPAPQAMTLEACQVLGLSTIPGDGLLPATVPALVDAWCLALQRYGRRSLARVLTPAIELAQGGWAAQRGLVSTIERCRQRFAEQWPTTAAVFLPGGSAPGVGQRVKNPGLAWALEQLAQGERDALAAGKSREDAIQAGRDVFYTGVVGEKIARHAAEVASRDASGDTHKSWLRAEDLSAYQGRVEEPLSVDFRGTTVFKCSSWTQGPVFLQLLRLLDGFPLERMEQADYFHTWLECAKLAFADREAHYGDPDHPSNPGGIPFERLLSEEYAAERRQLVNPLQASPDLRPGLGATLKSGPPPRAGLDHEGDSLGEPSAFMGDTTHVDAADSEGNLVAATPSGGWISSSPLIDGLGFPLGTRGQMFSLRPGHPNAVAPGKRPRATLTPSLAYQNGQPWLAFGTPGGDMQDQWTHHFFLNVVVHGLGLQEAIEAPSVHSLHFPASFYPRARFPRRVSAESRLPEEVIAELRRRGHDVEVTGPWEHGRVQAIAREAGRGGDGFLAAAVSPRRETAYAVGW